MQDAYSVNELKYSWTEGILDKMIAVKDDHLSEHDLTLTESLEDIENFKDGGYPINRGYYTVARRYEFYFRVAKQYFTNECSE